MAHLRRCLSLALLVALAAGCAGRPVRPWGNAAAEAAPGPEISPAVTVANAIATPLYLALKLAVCALTVGVGTPALAIFAVSDPERTWSQRRKLEDGFASNCGPPYSLF